MLSNSKTKLPTHPQLWFISVEDANNIIRTISLDSLHPTTQQRYQAQKSVKRQTQFLISRWLIKRAVEDFFSITFPFSHIQERIDDKPALLNLPEQCFYSLSHSNDWIVFAISHAKVGVDIEQIKHRENTHKLAREFMSESEYLTFCNRPSPHNLYRLWCYKEALYKSLSPKKQSQIQFTEIDSTHLDALNSQFTFEIKSEQFQCTLVSEQEIKELSCFVMADRFKQTTDYQTSPYIDTIWQRYN